MKKFILPSISSLGGRSFLLTSILVSLIYAYLVARKIFRDNTLMKSLMIKYLLLFNTCLLPLTTYAQTFSSGVETKNLKIQPIVGFERVQKVTPTPRTKTRMFYGLRALYGVPLLSAELQVTQAKDNETLEEGNLLLKETATTGMLGIYSSFNHASMLSSYFRAGGHGRKTEIEQTRAGETTKSEPSVRLSPYAGAGLNFRLAQFFSLTAGLTVIFTGEPQGSDREYQTDLGFNIHF